MYLKQEDITPQAKPFVKWVGGKRAIMNELLKHIPSYINNYYEPFVGGGALFFEFLYVI
jgi:DNA adenine methylase